MNTASALGNNYVALLEVFNIEMTFVITVVKMRRFPN